MKKVIAIAIVFSAIFLTGFASVQTNADSAPYTGSSVGNGGKLGDSAPFTGDSVRNLRDSAPYTG